MPMSTNPIKMWFGPMSGGDKNSFMKKLNELAIPYEDNLGKLTTKVKVSTGDQTPLMQLAVGIGNIGYGPAVEGGSGVSQADYNAAVKAKEEAETRRNEAQAAMRAAEEREAAVKQKNATGLADIQQADKAIQSAKKALEG